jgi:class 3 adenylate cyclase
MRCSNCGSDNPTGKRFCGDCGAALTNRCPKCGAENPPGKRFCGDCGTALAGSAFAQSPASSLSAPAIALSAEPTTPATAEGERKTVTALFADIKGSTELMEDLDPEEARVIIDPALKLMIDAVRRYDGYVVQSTGDGIFALFGAPLAHEDHPQRALYTAMRMRDELRRYSARLVADGGNPIQGRIGVNTGEIVVRNIETGDRQVEYTPIGHTVNLASRMQAVAPIGSIAATDSTRRLCEGYFMFAALGPTRMRGVSEPVEVHEVTGLGQLKTRLQAAIRRGLSRFVGRAREMEAMRHAADLAKNGNGQIVAAIGEPGVGKSRLFFEFKAVCQSGTLVLEAYSVSHGKASAYLPVIELLHDYFRIAADDDTRLRREKVIGKLLALDGELEDTLPYVLALVANEAGAQPLMQMDPQIRRHRTQDAVKRILLRESLNQPLIIVFEDLHWIDSETQQFLNLLADAIANARIQLLVNYRPEYHHQWGNRSYYTQLRLDPLRKENEQEMLSAMLGDATELQPFKRMVTERAEGNPFFVEEIVQALFDQGVLARNGNIAVLRPITQVNLPPTVQGMLTARIDRLASEEKELLQTLAAIGRDCRLSLVHKLADCSEAELSRMLADLEGAEFIYEQPAKGDIEYVFKHALTQEVAYNSMLVQRRRLLHQRIGEAIESLGGRIDDRIKQLAHQYSRSGDLTKAVHYLRRAGEQAAARSFEEAISQLSTALEFLQKLEPSSSRDAQELAIRVAMVNPMFVVNPLPATELEHNLERARVLTSKRE